MRDTCALLKIDRMRLFYSKKLQQTVRHDAIWRYLGFSSKVYVKVNNVNKKRTNITLEIK